MLDPKLKDDIENVIIGAGGKFKGSSCTCPFHRDRHPSAGLYINSNGNWRFRCHVCDINEDVIGIESRLTGKTPEEIVKEQNQDKEIVKKYTEEQIKEMYSTDKGWKYLHEYTDTKGLITHFVAVKYDSYEKKQIVQAKRYGYNFIMKNNGIRPLFRLSKIAKADKILVVEGEKCVMCAEHCGIISTTVMGGSSGVKYADLKPLSGKKIVIWPDNDVPGKKYAEELQEALGKIGCVVGIVDNDSICNYGEGSDIVDFFYNQKKEHPKENPVNSVNLVVNSIELLGEGIKKFYQYSENILKGKYSQLPTDFPKLQEDTRYTEGAQITLICGNAGTAKSFFIGQNFIKWKLIGLKVKIWSVENNREFHASRVFAQIMNEMKFCDKTWVQENGDEFLKICKENEDEIEKIMDMFYFSEDNSKVELIEFFKKYSADGYAAIGVDPVTFFSDSSDLKSYEADNKIMNTLNSLINKYHTRFFLVTHPRLDGNMTIDNIAGSRGFGRFCQNAMWISRIDEVYQGNPVNVSVLNMKTRSGTRKYGGKIAFNFNPRTAKFEEVVEYSKMNEKEVAGF